MYTFLFQREYCYGLKSVVIPSSRKSGHGFAIFSLTIMKDLGIVQKFLGEKVSRNNKGFFIGQSNYAKKLSEKHNFLNSKPMATPIDVSTKLHVATDQDESFDIETYQSAVGGLLYVSTRSRPDIAYFVSNVAKYCSKPTIDHWKAVKCIFRYIRGTISYGIL